MTSRVTCQAGIARLSLAVGLAVVLAAGGASSARAAVVSVDGATLVVRDSAGEANVLSVDPGPFGYGVFDEGAPLETGPGCSGVSAGHAVCAGVVMRVAVEAGGATDLVDLRAVTAPVTAHGGIGDDLLEGGGAGDMLDGGPGLDSLVAGDGNDRLSGESGRDLLQGEGGSDTLMGGDDRDVLDGGSDADELRGGQNSDWMRGGAGADTLRGEDGDDALVGGPGDDELITGTGTDTVFAADGDRDDIDCRAGDRVRRDRADADVDVACELLPQSAHAPRSWPPVDEATATARQAGVDARPTVRGRVLTHRNPQRIVVFVRHRRVFPGRVRGRVLGRRGQTLSRFVTVVETGNWRRIRLRPPRGAWRIRARCCV